MEKGLGIIWGLFDMAENEEVKAMGDRHRAMMTEVANRFKGKYYVVHTDTNKFKDALESMLGITSFPKIAVHKKAGDKKKYVLDGEITAAKIIEFVDNVEAGKVEAQLKS